MTIYSSTGQLVRTLVDGTLDAVWDGRNTAGYTVASGVYVYRLAGPQGIESRRMTLVR